MPSLCELNLPGALCDRFGAQDLPGLLKLLMFLGPITTVSRGNNVGFMMDRVIHAKDEPST